MKASHNLQIDTDRKRLDEGFVHTFISSSYWARDRSMETMRTCMDHSLNFGVYLDNRQIGYARVVSDYGQFAYIMDLFIDNAFRGKGYAAMLMDHLLSYPDLQGVKTWRLATVDAHGLYQKFGFTLLEHPENMMEKIN